MQIPSITNATPIRKVSFGNDLTESQKYTLRHFSKFLDENTQRTHLKQDSFIIQNQNKTIIEQNEKIINQGERILRALSYLAQSNANDMSADKVSAIYANMAKDIAEGKK